MIRHFIPFPVRCAMKKTSIQPITIRYSAPRLHLRSRSLLGFACSLMFDISRMSEVKVWDVIQLILYNKGNLINVFFLFIKYFTFLRLSLRKCSKSPCSANSSIRHTLSPRVQHEIKLMICLCWPTFFINSISFRNSSLSFKKAPSGKDNLSQTMWAE